MGNLIRRLLSCGVALLACAVIVSCQPEVHKQRPYLVLYAFDEEGRVLSESMSTKETTLILGRPVTTGELSGKPVVLAESGIGMTNAALTAQRLIDEYDPMAVVFSGIAGAIDSAVHIGDIVICQEWATHDYVYYGAQGAEPMPISVYHPGLDSIIRLNSFLVDSVMFVRARQLPEISIPLARITERQPRITVGGIGVSGNSFIDNVEKRQWLAREFNATIVDMETAAVAQVCEINGLPFIGFRSASDLAGGSGSSTAGEQLDQFFQVAANNSAIVVLRFLKSL